MDRSATLSSILSGSVPSLSPRSSTAQAPLPHPSPSKSSKHHHPTPTNEKDEDSPFDHDKDSTWQGSRSQNDGDNALDSGEPVHSPVESLDSQNSEESLESEQTSQESSVRDTWISWFCSSPGHAYFVQIPEEYIEDDFNLTGLSSIIPYFNQALDLILDLEPDSPTESSAYYESSAQLLYGLIHQRFIMSRGGLATMAERYESQDFGLCPRVGCGGCGVLPCGRSFVPGEETMKMYCPRCDDVYHPKEAKFQNIDGAFFGPTFPHLLFMTFEDLRPPLKVDQNLDDEDMHGDLGNYLIYTPRIFGFKLSQLSPVGPRMRWLRPQKRNVTARLVENIKNHHF